MAVEEVRPIRGADELSVARDCYRDVPQQHALGMPDLPMPPTPWPPSLEARRREVLATLAAATESVERRRDETAAALSRLAHPASRRVTSAYADGAALDVVG